MKRFTAVVSLALLCLVLNTWAAEQNADFSGTWILDSQNSDAAPIPVRDLGADVAGGKGGMGGGGFGGMGGGGFGGMGGGGFGGMGGGMGGPGFGRKGPAPKIEPAPLVIQQTDKEFRITSGMIVDGKENLTEEVYKLDGEEKVQNVPIKDSDDFIKYSTKVELNKDKFKIRSKKELPGTKDEVKKEYSLSKDGKVLTVKTKTTNQTGHMVMQTEQKQVYNKQ
jgi:hypothetical protein